MNGKPCAYREHRLVAIEEHQAWEVLNASFGQLRLVPSGNVLGIDTAAALRTARARGLDESTVSELLQAAEVGLIEAINEKGGELMVRARHE